VPVKQVKGKWEISGSERGIRFHRVLPEGSKKADATELERKLRREIFNTKELGHVPEVTIGEAILQYLKEFGGKAKRQTENHARALGPHVTGRTLSEIVEVAARCSATGGLSGSTKNRRLAILRRVAHLAYRRWGWLKEPLHEKIEMLPENPARQVYLGRAQLASLLRSRPDRQMRRAALVLAFTGLRKGELMGLEPDDLRGNTICLRDTKTGQPRNVPVLPSVRFALNRLPFTFHPTSLSHAVSRASGGKVRVHDLRHTTASLLIQAGVPLFTVGAILGHSSLQTTRRYAHLDTKSMETAISKLEPTRQIPAKNGATDKAA
jgi:integrase